MAVACVGVGAGPLRLHARLSARLTPPASAARTSGLQGHWRACTAVGTCSLDVLSGHKLGRGTLVGGRRTGAGACQQQQPTLPRIRVASRHGVMAGSGPLACLQRSPLAVLLSVGSCGACVCGWMRSWLASMTYGTATARWLGGRLCPPACGTRAMCVCRTRCKNILGRLRGDAHARGTVHAQAPSSLGSGENSDARHAWSATSHTWQTHFMTQPTTHPPSHHCTPGWRCLGVTRLHSKTLRKPPGWAVRRKGRTHFSLITSSTPTISERAGRTPPDHHPGSPSTCSTRACWRARTPCLPRSRASTR
jgi:hypothetical protein